MDIIARALVLLPHMLQVGTGDEHQVKIANHLARIAHHTAAARGPSYKIHFEYLMLVNGEVELLLPPVSHIHEVVIAQRRNLTQYSCSHYNLLTTM